MLTILHPVKTGPKHGNHCFFVGNQCDNCKSLYTKVIVIKTTQVYFR